MLSTVQSARMKIGSVINNPGPKFKRKAPRETQMRYDQHRSTCDLKGDQILDVSPRKRLYILCSGRLGLSMSASPLAQPELPSFPQFENRRNFGFLLSPSWGIPDDPAFPSADMHQDFSAYDFRTFVAGCMCPGGYMLEHLTPG